MSGTLDDYRRKRDFGRTPEPAPGTDGGGTPRARFVVHRHEARQLHYDLRLEVDGALKSWAVPKGFSYTPTDKRLAVRTEDHPIEYLAFEGVIPEGQYGAGTMGIWDRGVWELIGPGDDAARAILDVGELKVVLHGRRLRGEWHLVRTKRNDGRDWLLFKATDRYAADDRGRAVDADLSSAREAAGDLPRRGRFMRPGARRAPFVDPDWVFEMEFAGRRCWYATQDGAGRWLRVGRVRTGVLAPLDEELRGLRAAEAVLDGVLTALDPLGRPDRDALDAALGGDDGGEPYFYAFDLLRFDGLDVTALPLLERRALLASIWPRGAHHLQLVEPMLGEGERMAKAAAAAGLPGLIAKRGHAGYEPGRSDAWVHIRVAADAGASDKHVDAALLDAAQRASGRVRFTNRDKVYWPGEGFTKGDLLDYYGAVADVLLPYLRDRALHMRRFPDGIEGKEFYQRHPPEGVPEWVRTVELPRSREPDEQVLHVVCDDRDTLLWMINLGSIDLHPWLSKVDDTHHPDVVFFDLDPKGAPFQHVVRIARALGRVLRGIGLEPCVKTSGSTGIHVVLGLVPEFTYDQVRLFAEAVARVVVREHSEIATVERVVGARGGRVYIDVMQNRRGQTVVPPYVARPVPGARVSTPLHWDELGGALDASAFDLRTVPARLASVGDLFRPTLTERHDFRPAIARLEDYVRGTSD